MIRIPISSRLVRWSEGYLDKGGELIITNDNGGCGIETVKEIEVCEKCGKINLPNIVVAEVSKVRIIKEPKRENEIR
jgi:hypothetical protein